ncbi:MAG: T9SS type A sorting domain-containing protein, partial [Bacteroidia bacterium]|nr:T9SS type A sorting domain-containing protein [Bacteroidia bacterium]
GQGSLTLDLSGLSILNRGVYIIHVQNGNISLAHKLVKL